MAKKVFSRPKSLKENIFHYCPGCGHSIAHRLVAEVIDELGIRGITIGVPPAGCAVLAYNYFDVDMIEAQHGRGPAMATGIKRTLPDRVVFSYQGDGDLAAIGIAESFHAANRGENITVIFINNAVYGMTGGQMAPTTMLEQKTTTTPAGRHKTLDGYPVKVCELFSQLQGATYVERCTVNSPASINKTKKAIKKAFQCQIDGLGFSLVEILSPCPTNWKMMPIDSCKWIDEVMSKEFPLGVFKDNIAAAKKPAEAVIMIIKTIFSGFGGQGVLMMGVSLAHSAMNKGYHVTYLPAYGAEVRGGTANCTVAVADEEIASPVASEPDYLVAMNSPSLFTFQNKVTSRWHNFFKFFDY